MDWDQILAEARREGAAKQAPIRWNQARWERWLCSPEGSPAACEALSSLQKAYGKSGLTRKDLIELADIAREKRGQHAIVFLIAVMLWGYGDNDRRGPYRVAQMTQAPDTVDKILMVFDALDNDGLEEAYLLIQNKQLAGLPQLGASFATKVLCFAGAHAKGCVVLKPAILDSVVARSFQELENLPRFSAGWSWKNYRHYLVTLAAHASKAGVTIYDIEYQLFVKGLR